MIFELLAGNGFVTGPQDMVMFVLNMFSPNAEALEAESNMLFLFRHNEAKMCL